MVRVQDRADIGDPRAATPGWDRRSDECRRTRPTCTLARSFSYTSQTIQTWDRSAMVNRFGELSSVLTPAAAVTFCSVMTPETGATMSMTGEGWSTSAPSTRSRSQRGFHIDLGLLRGVLRDFQVLLRDRALVVQELGAVRVARCASVCVGLALPVIGERRGDVGALDAHQQLTLGRPCRPAARESRPRGPRPARSPERSATHPRVTTPVTFSSGAASRAAAVASGNCSGWSTLTRSASGSCSTSAAGGASAFGSGWPPLALQPAKTHTPAVTQRSSATLSTDLHGITSRPTARFNWLAAVRYEPTRFR